ncbi:MAG: DUF2007 domain-containing protein [Alphaproteobacteria bacterium]|nr:DUF2007 domain-containing protein [Alphaproteobacteria bacterium]
MRAVLLKPRTCWWRTAPPNLLSQEASDPSSADAHASVMDGSMGFLPRRLMVADDDDSRAEALLRAVMPDNRCRERQPAGRTRASRRRARRPAGRAGCGDAGGGGSGGGRHAGSGTGSGNQRAASLCLAARGFRGCR